ncbi:Dyp-type peroxidase [Kaarinaea lacus]
MGDVQAGILGPVPQQARYLIFTLVSADDAAEALQALSKFTDGDKTIVGFGASLVLALDGNIDGLRNFPSLVGPGLEVPATPAALWCWLRGDDRGELLHHGRAIEQALMPAFVLDEVLDGFMYADSRDLSGYVDGTENPQGEEAIAAAIVSGKGAGMDGSSFVAVQQWVHDLDAFADKSPQQRDHTFGRRISDNEEIEDAPESAHVKRTAQESFQPEAFVLRRSMPWTDGSEAGLNFVAFGKSFDAYEALLNRMVGKEDGIVDALFSFTRPVSGQYFWCPPMKNGKLDLSALGL